MSNGTAEGTVLLVDINIVDGSDPENFTLLPNGRVLFSANHTAMGKELWVTDGTSQGTMLIKDIMPGGGWSDPRDFFVVPGGVLFSADDGTNGSELWVTDGTISGTSMFMDINPLGSSYPTNCFQIPDGPVLFSAQGGPGYNELWVTDGTTSGTMRVRDINPGDSSNPSNFSLLPDERILFTANDSLNGTELWVTDGTASGTVMFADLNPIKNSVGSVPDNFLTVVLDTTPPLAPSIDAVANNEDTINAAEAAAGVTITGSAEAGASVTVTFGNGSETTAADTQGNWFVTFAPEDLPQDGDHTVNAVATDAANNISLPGMRPVVLDTAAPAAPVIALIAKDDTVNVGEAAAGVTVSGTAEAGVVVTITLGNASLTAETDIQGVWSVTFTADDDVPQDGNHTVSAIATDGANNSGVAGTRSVVIDTEAPDAPVINVIAGDDRINGAEGDTGITITGSAEAGALIGVSFGNAIRSTTADSEGAWSISFLAGETPEDGEHIVTVSANDVAEDDRINAAEASSGVTISDTAEAGASVTVGFGAALDTVTADAMGGWSITYSSVDTPEDGERFVTVLVQDAAGNAVAPVGRWFMMDRAAPLAPVINYTLATGNITGDSTSNFTEAGGGARMVTITDGTIEHFTILTGSGADTITTGNGDDTIQTGNGASTVTADQGANIIVGGNDADTITALDGGNRIEAGNGSNTVTTGGGPIIFPQGQGPTPSSAAVAPIASPYAAGRTL